MNREDERAIEHECARLVALSANLTDAGQFDALAGLFSDDGRMSRPSAPDEWIEGYDAILESLKARPPRMARHFCANVVIEVISGTEAKGECAIALFTSGGAVRVGSYHDRFVKTLDGWKFVERRGTMLF